MRVMLTTAQADLLRYLGRKNQRVARNYKPAVRLAELGLAIIQSVPPPHGWLVTITEAGRSALRAEREG